jgi:hypothetical protein
MNNKNISETLNFIVTLQKNAGCNDNCADSSCTRPFLGPVGTTVCFNTRPVTLYTCCTGALWEFPYEINGTEGTSTVFRVENVEGNCATFRVLIPNTVGDETTYTLSNSYFTIDLSCVLALQCLADTYVI